MLVVCMAYEPAFVVPDFSSHHSLRVFFDDTRYYTIRSLLYATMCPGGF